jgi:hypothetical protein
MTCIRGLSKVGVIQIGEQTHRNTDVLQLFGGVRITRIGTKTFHPCVCNAIEKYHERLHELSTWVVTRWGSIPGPSELREGAQKTSKCDQAITPENAAFCNEQVSG